MAHAWCARDEQNLDLLRRGIAVGILQRGSGADAVVQPCRTDGGLTNGGEVRRDERGAEHGDRETRPLHALPLVLPVTRWRGGIRYVLPEPRSECTSG